MKRITKAALIATLGAAMTAGSASAATTYNTGDLLLGMRQTGNGNDYVVDLGAMSIYYNAAPGVMTVSGPAQPDMQSVFGLNWSTSANVSWGLAATSGGLGGGGFGTKPERTLWASRAESTPGTEATPWVAGSGSTQGTVASRITAFGQSFGGQNETANSSSAIIQAVSAPNSYDFSVKNPSGISFGFFNPTIEGNFGSGTGGSILDLFELQPGFGTPGTYVGSFKFEDDGRLLFSTTGNFEVPEPGSASLLGGAGLLFFVMRRRQQAVAI